MFSCKILSPYQAVKVLYRFKFFLELYLLRLVGDYCLLFLLVYTQGVFHVFHFLPVTNLFLFWVLVADGPGAGGRHEWRHLHACVPRWFSDVFSLPELPRPPSVLLIAIRQLSVWGITMPWSHGKAEWLANWTANRDPIIACRSLRVLREILSTTPHPTFAIQWFFL